MTRVGLIIAICDRRGRSVGKSAKTRFGGCALEQAMMLVEEDHERVERLQSDQMGDLLGRRQDALRRARSARSRWRYGVAGFREAYTASPARWKDHLAIGRPLPIETWTYFGGLQSSAATHPMTRSRWAPSSVPGPRHPCLSHVRSGRWSAVKPALKEQSMSATGSSFARFLCTTPSCTRQRNSKPVTILCLRATCETLTPAWSLSRAMARFCSSVKKRRTGLPGPPWIVAQRSCQARFGGVLVALVPATGRAEG